MPFVPVKTLGSPVEEKPTVQPQSSGAKNSGIFSRLKEFDKNVLSDIDLGKKLGSGLVKGLIGNTLKTAVQMPQSFATGVLGLADAAGVEGASELREQVAKPITAPIVGEVKPLSAVPTDEEAANPKEALGQAVGMLPEAATFGAFKMPLADKIPKTALGKLAQSFGVGTEYGALAGASRSMQEDKPVEEILGDTIQSALMSGTISMGLTAASMVPTGELSRVPRDVANLASRAKEWSVEKMKSIMPLTTNIKKADIKLAQDPDIAPRVLERLEVMRGGAQSGQVQEAEDQLKQMNFERYKSVYERAKDTAQKNYGAARRSIEKAYGDKTVGGKNVLEHGATKSVELAKGRVELDPVKHVSPVVHISGESDGSEILTDMYRRIQKSGTNPNVRELFELKDDLHDWAQSLDQGTRSYRAGMFMIDTVDSEINRLTADRAKDMNAAYRAFKEAQTQVAPLWKNNAKWDSRLNFVKLLEGASKTGSRKALIQLEEIAGMSGYVNKELQASRLARLLSMEKGITGPRQLDDVVRTVIIGAPAAFGGAIGGPAGAGLGALAGSATLKQLQSPSWWSDVLFRSIKSKGIDVTADQVVNIVNSPLFQQTIQTMLGSFEDNEESNSTSDFYAE